MIRDLRPDGINAVHITQDTGAPMEVRIYFDKVDSGRVTTVNTAPDPGEFYQQAAYMNRDDMRGLLSWLLDCRLPTTLSHSS